MVKLALATGTLAAVGFVAWWLQRWLERCEQYDAANWTHNRARIAWGLPQALDEDRERLIRHGLVKERE